MSNERVSNYRVLVTTSDDYLPAVRVYAWLFNRYWSPKQHVTVLGYRPPNFELPSNFEFVSLGPQADYPITKWSNALVDFLGSIDDEVFTLMLEDYWITRPVNVHAVQILHDYMIQFRYVAKIDLCADRLYAHGMTSYGHVSYVDLVKSMPGSPYHLSLMTGLWRREHLLRALVPDESPWDVEIHGTTRLSHMQDVIVLGTRIWPIRHILAFRGGDSGKLDLTGIGESDVNELKNLGYLSHWEDA